MVSTGLSFLGFLFWVAFSSDNRVDYDTLDYSKIQDCEHLTAISEMWHLFLYFFIDKKRDIVIMWKKYNWRKIL